LRPAVHVHEALSLIFRLGAIVLATIIGSVNCSEESHVRPLAAIIQKADSLFIEGQFSEAQSLLQEALTGYHEGRFSGSDFDIATARYRLAATLYALRIFETADSLCLLSTDAFVKLPDTELVRAQVLELLGDIRFSQSRFTLAEAALNQSISLQSQTLGADHPQLMRPLEKLANAILMQQEPERAIPLWERILEMREVTRGRCDSTTLELLEELSVWYVTTGRYGEAETLLRDAISFLPNCETPNLTAIAPIYLNLANCLHRSKKYSEAGQFARTALELAESIYGSEDCELIRYLRHYAVTLVRLDQAEPALEFYTRIIRLVGLSACGDGVEEARYLAEYAKLLEMQGRTSEATEVRRRLSEIDE
jgi:tetratricopeptide (TPR) repeat protein